ncbi:FHA domain-containing protein [Streptomyces millisiae]|uniref:FHA domain-containing protein n=1 Tax=Streptomyces millisiae TaxID=3075542 RepID=A0ABU2LPR5_9ACTN|nr:FHA domain-containing protein [Streptomyces sp. DSM 44918]MDT0319582.1 FHA domain-containing protein [Streptomyces sp. DSM 44918]
MTPFRSPRASRAATPPAVRPTLARGVPHRPSRPPRTLHASSTQGTLWVPPEPERVVRFGRNTPKDDPEVHLTVGGQDQSVSRRHGELTFRDNLWWLRNIGQQLVRLPRGLMLHHTSEPVPLAGGYTPLFVKGSGGREHLVELFVTDHERPEPRATPGAPTVPPKRWELTPEERLVAVVLGQSYLRYEPDPRPVTYREANAQLRHLRPEDGWTARKVERRAGELRHRLHAAGFPPTVIREEGGPYDAHLLHNLLKGLVETTSLVPPDLTLLDD